VFIAAVAGSAPASFAIPRGLQALPLRRPGNGLSAPFQSLGLHLERARWIAGARHDTPPVKGDDGAPNRGGGSRALRAEGQEGRISPPLSWPRPQLTAGHSAFKCGDRQIFPPSGHIKSSTPRS